VDGYKELFFDSDPTKKYYAMFVGQPVFYYIDQSKDSDINANNRKLIGYVELTARCNSGTAFGNAISIEKLTTHTTSSYQLVNNGDEKVFPSLVIKTPAAGSITMPFKVEIKNLSNNTSIILNGLSALDTITVDMSIRTITAEKTPAIYTG
jgi:phage-related protein